MNKFWLTIVLLLAFIFVLLAVYKSPASEPGKETKPSVESLKEKARWSVRIDAVGAAAAYEEYKQEYANKHFGVQHTVAHIMGELLYETLGLDGLAVCDSTFSFGCYHSFFGQALAAHGTAIVKKLNEICLNKYGQYGTGCQHGIGHGLLEYFGHSQLVKALETCSQTTRITAIHGCTSGVFMEYNVPIIVTENSATTETRKIDFNKPYDPCPDLIHQFQQSCYYELPQWWDKVTTYNGDYLKIGQLCSALNDEKNREFCFLGVGNVAAPSSQYVVDETIKKCEKMPTFDEQVICRSGASWSFFAAVDHREKAAAVCEGLEADISHRCVEKSDLIGNRL